MFGDANVFLLLSEQHTCPDAGSSVSGYDQPFSCVTCKISGMLATRKQTPHTQLRNSQIKNRKKYTPTSLLAIRQPDDQFFYFISGSSTRTIAKDEREDLAV